MVRSLAALGIALVATVPATVALADCLNDRAADRAFAHPYGEPAKCQDEPASPSPEADRDLREDHPSALRVLGISGLAAGSSIAGLGGTLWFTSLFLDDQSRSYKVLHPTGIGVAIAGGALFLAGATLLGIDALSGPASPAPTPDGRGAQLLVSWRW